MGETVEFPSNGHTCGGYLASPPEGRGPGVVVLQEWWGLVPHIRDVCDRLGAEGFVALAPDLYHGKQTREPDQAQKLLMELQLDQAARDMAGAAEWLVESGRCEGDRLGVIGFCMGGALAIYAATVSQRFGAVVAFYPAFAATDRAKPDVSRIRGAVQGHFAERDHSYSRERVGQLEEQLRSAGVAVEAHWYPDTDHAFFNDTRPEVHKPDAAAQAWQRSVDFLRRHLAPTGAAA